MLSPSPFGNLWMYKEVPEKKEIKCNENKMFVKDMYCDRGRIRNEEIRRRIGVQVDMLGRT